MPTFFANPAGFYALLALPVIVLIHMLRERSRRVRVSTLFLLEPLAPRTPRGTALHWVQNSIPLWLQLLSALLIAWLLADPRWVRANSVQSVRVVLDASASMSACQAKVLADLPNTLREASRKAARTEWIITATGAPGEPLYRGFEFGRAIEALAKWEPLLPHHDAEPAFRTALIESKGVGTILFISDRPPEMLPAGIQWIGYGTPLENCGFAGVRAWEDGEGAHWEALVKNSGSTVQERTWWFETPQMRSQAQTLRLAPGQIQTVPGPFLPGTPELTVKLSPDAFSLDDELPLVVPKAKPLRVTVNAEGDTGKSFTRMALTLPGVSLTKSGESAAVVIAPAGTAPVQGAAILFGGKRDGAEKPKGAITREDHPLMEGLVWEGLLSTGAGSEVMAEADAPLLWQGERPMIFLRKRGAAEQLALNFDVAGSNAFRVPAFVLLLTRFLERVRDESLEPHAENFETHQKIELPSGAKGTITLAGEEAGKASGDGAVRAPLRPGFFQIGVHKREFLHGAAHFGDPRESDFSAARSTERSDGKAELVRRELALGDPLATLWLLLIGAALGYSWHLQRGGAPA